MTILETSSNAALRCRAFRTHLAQLEVQNSSCRNQLLHSANGWSTSSRGACGAHGARGQWPWRSPLKCRPWQKAGTWKGAAGSEICCYQDELRLAAPIHRSEAWTAEFWLSAPAPHLRICKGSPFKSRQPARYVRGGQYASPASPFNVGVHACGGIVAQVILSADP